MLFQCWPTRWANIETALGGCPLSGSCLIMRGQLAVGLPVTAYFSGEQLPPFGFVHTSHGRPVYARLTFGTLRSILKQDMTCQVSNCNEVIKGSSEVMWCSKTNIQPIKYEVGSTMSIDPILSPMLDQLLPLGRWVSIQLIVTSWSLLDQQKLSTTANAFRCNVIRYCGIFPTVRLDSRGRVPCSRTSYDIS